LLLENTSLATLLFLLDDKGWAKFRKVSGHSCAEEFVWWPCYKYTKVLSPLVLPGGFPPCPKLTDRVLRTLKKIGK
jgi:hypothetical protein